MRTPADYRFVANISSLIEGFFGSAKRKTDSNYDIEVVISDRGIPIGKISANAESISIYKVGEFDNNRASR